LIYTVYRLVRKVLRKFHFGFMLLFFPRDFEQDGLATSRIRQFENDSSFIQARKETVRMIGSDFQIDWRSHVFLWAYRETLHLPGSALELGTGKAWMFTMALNHGSLPDLGEVFLVDRFSSLAVNKKTGEPIQGTDNSYYSADLENLRSRFATQTGVKFVQGEIPTVLETLHLERIRFVHVDLNAASPEVEGLRYLWDKIIFGGIVLLDDYGSPEFVESHDAMDALAKELGFGILGLPTGQGLIVKLSVD
jgi:O-methyltransferase